RPAPRGGWVATGFGYTRRRVQGLRNLREEAVVRSQPEPFDGCHEAALQPEPAARPDAAERQGDACLRLHALPQGRQGHESALARPGLARPGPTDPLRTAKVFPPRKALPASSPLRA